MDSNSHRRIRAFSSSNPLRGAMVLADASRVKRSSGAPVRRLTLGWRRLRRRSDVVHRLAAVAPRRVLIIVEDHEGRALRPAYQRRFGLGALYEAQALRAQRFPVNGRGAV